MNSLLGKKALVVGGSTGIGRAVANAWSQAGMDVHVISRNPPENQGILRWTKIDLSDPIASYAELVSVTQEPLDAVCFAAIYYGTQRTDFSSTPLVEWRQQLEVNLNGLWMTLHTTLPVLRKSKLGLFLNISSEVAYNGGPGRSGYAATKSAGASLINSILQEDDSNHINIVSVLPEGMVDSAGIRRRRPANFNYSSYMSPESFEPISIELVTNPSLQYHGDSLVVQADGRWKSISEISPISQSNRG